MTTSSRVICAHHKIFFLKQRESPGIHGRRALFSEPSCCIIAIWPRNIYGEKLLGKSSRAHVYKIEMYAMHVAPRMPLLKPVDESAFSRCRINVSSAAIAKRNTYLISGVLLSIDTHSAGSPVFERRAGGPLSSYAVLLGTANVKFLIAFLQALIRGFSVYY